MKNRVRKKILLTGMLCAMSAAAAACGGANEPPAAEEQQKDAEHTVPEAEAGNSGFAPETEAGNSGSAPETEAGNSDSAPETEAGNSDSAPEMYRSHMTKLRCLPYRPSMTEERDPKCRRQRLPTWLRGRG